VAVAIGIGPILANEHKQVGILTVLPRGRKFCLTTQNGRKKLCGPRKSASKFLVDLSKKRAEKGSDFFVVWFCTTPVIFSAEHSKFSLI
jgi:hypothetical protein